MLTYLALLVVAVLPTPDATIYVGYDVANYNTDGPIDGRIRQVVMQDFNEKGELFSRCWHMRNSYGGIHINGQHMSDFVWNARLRCYESHGLVGSTEPEHSPYRVVVRVKSLVESRTALDLCPTRTDYCHETAYERCDKIKTEVYLRDEPARRRRLEREAAARANEPPVNPEEDMSP
jgi:hypothetical protein